LGAAADVAPLNLRTGRGRRHRRRRYDALGPAATPSPASPLIGLFVQIPLLWTAVAAVSALIFSAFLVYDLNRIARAKEVSEGDAILLAVSVYLDIFNLFLDLLLLLSGRRRAR
jgi:hypothetical protein